MANLARSAPKRKTPFTDAAYAANDNGGLLSRKVTPPKPYTPPSPKLFKIFRFSKSPNPTPYLAPDTEANDN